jgi:5-methylcytosine-specific restriction endonuclease McrA
LTLVYHAIQLSLLNPSIEHVSPECVCPGKLCNGCQKLLCFGCFHRLVRSKDGLRPRCKVCRKSEYMTAEAKAKKRDYNAKNADRINTRRRKYYRANAEQERARQQDYRKRNPEKIKAYILSYEQTQPGKARVRRWQKRNAEAIEIVRKARFARDPEQFRSRKRPYARVKQAERRTRKTQAGGSYTVAEWQSLKIQYDYRCLCCGKHEPEIKLCADHVIPVTKGGSSYINNIQPLCQSCNSRKGAKIIDYRTQR